MERHTDRSAGGQYIGIYKTCPKPRANGLPPSKPYEYRGRGYDIYDPDNTGRFYGFAERQDQDDNAST